MNITNDEEKKQKLLAAIRWEGSALLNAKLVREGKEPTPFKRGPSITDCVPCPHCGARFSKKTLHRHYKYCSGKKSTPRNIVVEAAVEDCKDMPKEMSDTLKTVILPGMHAGEVVDELKNDPDIIDFGNSQCFKYRNDIERQKSLIRARLRALAKLKLVLQELDPTIKRLRDIFNCTKWNTFVNAVSTCANLDKDPKKQSPNNVISLGQCMSNLAKDIKVGIPVDEEGMKLRNELQAWVELYHRRFYSTIGREATKLSEQRKWEGKSYAPVARDVVALTTSLKNDIKGSLEKLNQKFSLPAWETLNKSCMLSLLIFNRKRKAEVQYMTKEDFERKKKVDRNTDIFESLTKTEQMISQRYFHVMVRGKLSRPVALLIEENLADTIQRIIDLRYAAGVSPNNPYLFAKGESKYFNAYTALSEAVYEINAEAPELLNSRRLRTHIASVAQALDLTETDLRSLSSFLGHSTQTHLEHYRMPSDALNTAKISRLLVALDNGKLSHYKGKRIEDIDVNIPITDIMNEEGEEVDDPQEIMPTSTDEPPGSPSTVHPLPAVQSTPTKQKIRKRKLVTPTKVKSTTGLQGSPSPKRKVRWSTPEKKVMLKAFNRYLVQKDSTLPSFKECFNVRSENPILKTRKPHIMKAWVFNEKRKRKSQH